MDFSPDVSYFTIYSAKQFFVSRRYTQPEILFLYLDWFLWARDSAKFWKCFTCHNFSCRSKKAIQKWRGVVVGVLLHVSNNYTNYLTVKTMSFSSHVEIQLSSWVLIKVIMYTWAHDEMISVILGNRNVLFIAHVL